MVAALLPVTGMAFLLFTFYMATDPATTPSRRSVSLRSAGRLAATYGLLTAFHVVFGLFFSLLIICSLRGLGLAVLAWVRSPIPISSHGDRPIPARVSLASSPVLEVAE